MTIVTAWTRLTCLARCAALDARILGMWDILDPTVFARFGMNRAMFAIIITSLGEHVRMETQT